MGFLVEAAVGGGAASLMLGPTAWWVVTGNQACDADSIVSAITMGYLIRRKAAIDSEQVVPWLQCTAAEMALRPDAAALLARAGVQPAALVFRGVKGVKSTGLTYQDNELRMLQKRGLLKLTLLDHNRLPPGPQSGLSKSVVSIIDHHADSSKCKHVTGTDRVIAYGPQAGFEENCGVGSCCTLVAEQYFEHAPDLLAAEPAIGTLLLGAILIDTENLGPRNRTTDRDVAAVEKLYELSGTSRLWGSALPDRDQLYKELKVAKYDEKRWLAVPPATLLTADFKAFLTPALTAPHGAQTEPLAGVGVSSVLVSLDKVADPAAFVAAVQQRTADYNLGIGMVMSYRPADGQGAGPSRMLLIHCPDSIPGLRDQLRGYLESLQTRFGLEPADCELAKQSADTLVYHQRNAKTSRKVLAQALDAFFTVPFEQNRFVLEEGEKIEQRMAADGAGVPGVPSAPSS